MFQSLSLVVVVPLRNLTSSNYPSGDEYNELHVIIQECLHENVASQGLLVRLLFTRSCVPCVNAQPLVRVIVWKPCIQLYILPLSCDGKPM